MKLTIKEKYDKAKFPRIRAGLDLMRPLTIIPAIIAGFFITTFSMLYNGYPFVENWQIGIFAGIVLAVLQAGGQTLNQAHPEEIKIDNINNKGKYRPIPNILSKEDGVGLALILFLIGIFRSFLININFGIFALIITFFAIEYTYEPIRAKRFLLINNFWQSISRGLLPILACYSIFGNPLGLLPLSWGILAMLFVTGAQTTKDFGDIKGDKKFNISTLPVKYNEIKTKIIMFGFILSGYSLLQILILVFNAPEILYTLYLTMPLALCSIFFTNKDTEKFENNIGWILFYSTLGLIFIIPLLTLLYLDHLYPVFSL